MTFPVGRFRLGVNFWSRAHGPRMWSRGDTFADELAQARGMGLDLLRVFAFLPDFVRSGRVEAPALERLARFADDAHRVGLALLPSPLVGHMSGENFPDPSSLFDDAALTADPAALVDAVARALAKRPAVVGYTLTNELPLWAGLHEGKRPRPEAIVAWCQKMVALARAAHPGVPIGLGDGLMHGFPHEALARHVDFVGPHVYEADPDPLRWGYRYDHALRRAALLERPVVFEEFGGSSTQVSEAHHADLWNEALFAAFSLGARGALGWCWSDFDVDTLGREVPYEHHAFELGFGLTRADGSEKPAAQILRAWRALLDQLPDAPPVPAPSRVGLVRSSFLDRDYPFSWVDRGLCERAELTALTLADQAGLQPRLCRETSLEGDLLLLPCVQRLLTSTWLELEARVTAGATLYWSYFGGDHLFHQGAWCPIFERLTGCRHTLRYGVLDLPDAWLRLDGVFAGLPAIPTNASAIHEGADGAAAAAYLPIEPVSDDVRVLSKDPRGRPMLVEHTLGHGHVLFCAAPLERYAARLADGTSRGLSLVYRVLRDRARVPTAMRHGLELSDALCLRDVSVGARELTIAMNRGLGELPLATSTPVLWSSGAAGPTLKPKQVVVLERTRTA